MVQSDQTPAATGEWECMECNHILEGTAQQRPTRCPECNAGPEAFEFFSFEDEELEGDLEEEDEEADDYEDELDDFEDFDEEDDLDYDEDGKDDELEDDR
jgi:hypothetical protein